MEDELIHPLAAAYALDALGPMEEQAYEAHLASCSRCQAEVASFSETAAALAYAAPAAELPASLRARILTAAHEERAQVITLRPRWTYPAMAAAAVAACAAVGIGVWAATLNSGSHGRTLETLALRGATGSVVVTSGGEAALVVSGIPPAPAGKTYEVWVMRGTGAVRAGVFVPHVRTTTVPLTRPLPSGSFVGVTLERAGGASHPTGQPLFTSATA